MILSGILLRFGHSDIGFFFYLIIFIALGILTLALRIQGNKIAKQGKKERNIIRNNWVRIPVEYNEIEIKSNSWKQEIVVGSGTDSRNEYVDVNQNILILEKKHADHLFSIEVTIDMVTEILKMKLAIQKELSLYYNPKNPNEVFLDLEFLFV